MRCKKGDCAIFETFTVYKIELFILKNMAVQLTAGFFGIVHRKVFTGPLHGKGSFTRCDNVCDNVNLS